MVLGGRSRTLTTVNNALKDNTPVVIIEGSGGAADILAYAFKHLAKVEDYDKDNEGQANMRTEKHMTKSLECKIKDKMKKEKIDCNIDVIKECLAKSDLIHIFKVGRDNHGIDAVMLNALMKANEDLVKNNIAADKKKMTFSLDNMMMHAIQFASADFVKLLLNNGVKLETFLTVDNLLQLYNNAPSKSIFKDLWSKKKEEVSLKRMCSMKEKEETITLKDVMHLVQYLVGDNYLQHYTQDRYKDSDDANEDSQKESDANEVQKKDHAVSGIQIDVNKLETKQQNVNEIQTKDLTANEVQANNPGSNELQKNEQDVNEKKTKGEEFAKKPDFENPCHDLFIWSVLNNQQDKAKLFWDNGKDKIAAALAAHALFSAMESQIDDRELLEGIDDNSTEFMALAIKVAKKCYETDPKKTQHLMICKMKQWGNATCIEIAVNARNNEFVSLQACYDVFDEIWMGGLKQENSIRKLLPCMVFPPLILLLARFQEKADQLSSSIDATLRERQKLSCCRSSKLRKVDPNNLINGTSEQVNYKPDTNAANENMHQANGNSNRTTNGKRVLTAWEKVTTFYNAPIIIFMYNVKFFIAFLSLYIYFVISTLEPKISALEIILFVWVTSFLIGEIIQVLRIPASSICRSVQLYIADEWNVLNMLTNLLFISGAAVLMTRPQAAVLEAARSVLATDLVLFFLRILPIFHAHRTIGPKLVMITKMVWDLGLLAAIVGVFILVYAIAFYAILYPDTKLTTDTVMAILKQPYWNIYEDFVLEYIQGADNCSNDAAVYRDGTVPRCPTEAGQYVAPVMMGIYMLMTNIMLLSLLIATFSYSIEKVQQQEEMHYSMRRYNLICEYYTKSWLAQPLALLVYLVQISLFACGKMQCPKLCLLSAFTQRGNAFKQTFVEDYTNELRQLEELSAATVYQRMERNSDEIIDKKVSTISKRLDQLVKKFDRHLQTISTKEPKSSKNRTGSSIGQNTVTATESSSTNLETKVANIERKVKNMETKLDFMSKLLQSIDHKLGAKQTLTGETDVKVED